MSLGSINRRSARAADSSAPAALPLRELRSLCSLRPLPQSTSSSLCDNSYLAGPSPCPCPGVDTSLSGNASGMLRYRRRTGAVSAANRRRNLVFRAAARKINFAAVWKTSPPKLFEGFAGDEKSPWRWPEADRIDSFASLGMTSGVLGMTGCPAFAGHDEGALGMTD